MHADLKPTYDKICFYTQPRDELMHILTDDDLTFAPSRHNPTLGELCRQMGENQHIYVESLKTFTADFTYRNTDDTLATRVERLAAWYTELDKGFESALISLTDEDVKQPIQRGDFTESINGHLEIYREALLLFYGRVHVYLLAMGKPLPPMWKAWFT